MISLIEVPLDGSNAPVTLPITKAIDGSKRPAKKEAMTPRVRITLFDPRRVPQNLVIETEISFSTFFSYSPSTFFEGEVRAVPPSN